MIAIDQLGNTLLGGWADETISARCHRKRHMAKWRRLGAVIDFLALCCFGQANHCEAAYNSEREMKQLPIEYRTK